jgi:FdhD protein
MATTLSMHDQQTERFPVRRFSRSGIRRVTDIVTREEPLEIRITYSFKSTRRTESFAMTMRTPGHDEQLVAGFLCSEGVIASSDDIVEIRALGGAESNEILVELAPNVDVEEWRLRRATLLSSACGLCGKRAIESIPEVQRAGEDELRVSPDLIYRLPGLLRQNQSAFEESGGLHAAGLVSPDGGMLSVFEDVGRHNALDKLIGAHLLEGRLPLRGRLLFMSSRGSFELVQKSLAAGCGMLVTIGAPSSLAIEFASARELTLIGFVREDHFNVYSGDWRLVALG